MTPKITDNGNGLIVRALYGSDSLIFSKIVLGNGECPDNYMKLDAMMNPIVEIGLDSIERNDNYISIKGTLQNIRIEAGFQWTEIGIFCKNPDGTEDILYAYGHYLLTGADDDDVGMTYIPKFGNDVVEVTITVVVFVGEIENVSAILAESSEYATSAALREHTEADQNPHNVTKEQVGLGKVPNVPTNEQTPTFSLPTTLTELLSGETLTIAFGKLAFAVRSLISHINNTTAHITTAERTAWNSKAAGAHNHAATAINSGTLGVARGGTGAATAEAAMHTLGGIFAGSVGSAYRIPNSANLNSYTTGGTYWCTSGDVAKTLKNCPYTNTNFVFLVFAPSPSQVFQMILPNRSNDSIAIYFRALNDKWGPWKKTTTSNP